MLVLHNDSSTFSAVEGAYSFTVTDLDTGRPRLTVWTLAGDASTEAWHGTLPQSRTIARQHHHGTAVRAFMDLWDNGTIKAWRIWQPVPTPDRVPVG
jgi:hypothetical protein